LKRPTAVRPGSCQRSAYGDEGGMERRLPCARSNTSRYMMRLVMEEPPRELIGPIGQVAAAEAG
jgi:hypothetical protein